LAELATQTGLSITVCHFPPGTSKWNKIEHVCPERGVGRWGGRQHEPCCASDGGRSSGFAEQAESPNRRSVMPVKSRGGKRLWKRPAISGSGTRREDERVNHSLRIEILNDDIETRVGVQPWDKGAPCGVSSAGERPVCGLGGVRCRGGV